MTAVVTPELQIDIRIDPRTLRHYYNDHLMVVHCHHYSTLYTQLAMDAGETRLLQDVSEDMFYSVLSDYFKKNSLSNNQPTVLIHFTFVGVL